jgi:hypothetical protein
MTLHTYYGIRMMHISLIVGKRAKVKQALRRLYIDERSSKASSHNLSDELRLDGLGSIPGRGKRFFSTPQRPDRFWGPPSLFSNGCPG